MYHRTVRPIVALSGVLLAFSGAVAAVAAANEADLGAEVDFQRDVRPILAENCFQCHGPDAVARQADLRLDTRAGAFADRGTGPAVVPGDPSASRLVERVRASDPRRRMPPAVSRKSLEADEVDALVRWIADGAVWDEHWSFSAIADAEPPPVDNETWARVSLDRFVLARLEREGLEPAPEADRRSLARRVALDLTGLPPDPGTLASFLADEEDGAYERLVDHLLSSPHWGEHRARYWLDAARYGDTHGVHIDNYREMYAYRDWVIDAFNRNLTFDRFTVEQIAGDLLEAPTLDQLVATGFQRNNITTNEGGAIPEEYEAIYAKDRAETVGNVFLGLSVGCATCHDHKFDPISQREFYALTAFFRNTTQYVMDGNVADPPPVLVVPADDDRELWRDVRERAVASEAALAERRSERGAGFEEWLASGAYRDLAAPLRSSDELLRLDLDSGRPALGGRPTLTVSGRRARIDLAKGTKVRPGPRGQRALVFDDDSWAELPSLDLDTDTPLTLSLWILMPEGEGSFMVAGQYDPNDGGRGWTLTIGARQLFFRMAGDRPAPERGATSARIGPINTKRMEEGEWAHIVVTHDGTGERAGLRIYKDGEPIEAEGSEYFARVEGSIATDLPFFLGRGDVSDRSTSSRRHFAGGGIADLRILDRVVSAEEAKVLAGWSRISDLGKTAPEELDETERELLALRYLSLEDEELESLRNERAEIESEWREIRRRGTVTHVMQERADAEPVARVLHRGMYDQPRDLVAAATPSVLPPMDATVPRNRMGLAQWLVTDENPLTARVTVNRFWQQVFGTGLVSTSEDFGAQGELPSHPELLDHLAGTFRESGWDTKGFFRTLVTSATYRQATTATPAKLEADPRNRLLSRGPRFRMDAEMIRDQALAASGLLVRTIGGPSVKPYQPEGVWSSVAMPVSNTARYERDEGDKLYRRSLYTFWKRSAPPAAMKIFNAPTREHSTVRRERTNTPLQALVTMNDTQFVEAARHLAQRALREAGYDFDRRLDYLSTRLLARDLAAAERAVVRHGYERLLAIYREDEAGALDLLEVGDSALDAALPTAESAAWTLVASQLMNLDEALNK